MATVPNKNFNTILTNTKNRECSFFVVSDLLINSGHVIKHTQYNVFIIYIPVLVLLPPAVRPNYCVESAHKKWPREFPTLVRLILIISFFTNLQSVCYKLCFQTFNYCSKLMTEAHKMLHEI